MAKKFGDYYLGFDIGTNSVGWAVTDLEYKVLNFNNKAMWGVHLFEEGKSAAERRVFRSGRRRLERRKERVALLRLLFRDEINKVDPNFYERMADSKFITTDKKIIQKNTLFDDEEFNDKSYYKLYPTIYHLRSELIHNNGKHDIRLVYLALQHILKHRGHFLFEGQDFKEVTSFGRVFSNVLNVLEDYGFCFGNVNAERVEELLKAKMSLRDKSRELELAMISDKSGDNYKQQQTVVKLIAGSKIKLSDLFDDENLNDAEINSISFSDGIDEVVDVLEDILLDKMMVIRELKSVYDWSILNHILKDNTYISDAKKATYDEHQSDLKMLKQIINKYLKDAKKEILTDKNSKENYVAYIGQSNEKIIDQETFNKFIVKKLNGVTLLDDEEIYFMEKLKENKAFPKQVVKENGIVPYQLHRMEMKEILSNASTYYPFLLEKDSEGLTVIDKIDSIMTFRIPYYVGPLNANSKFAWIKRLTEGKIYPWNFDKVVDKEASANEFIRRMTNKCTYLVNADVLPKQSILYAKYNILNQLNNLKVNEEKLPVAIKQQIFEDLFLNVEKPRKVTFKLLKGYFVQKGLFTSARSIELSGVDGEIVGDMKAYVQFKKILGESMPNTSIIDQIISRIVILGESKELLKNYLNKEYKDKFTSNQIKEICKLSFTGWGNFSKEFLNNIYHLDESIGELINIIDMMYNSQENLMQLLSNNYSYIQSIKDYNEEYGEEFSGLNIKILDDLYVSPAVRRSIWRVLMLSKEIVKVTGHEPTKIFIEMARDVENNGKKGKRTTSRKNQLMELYNNCKEDEEELYKSLELMDEGRLRDNRLYLYYTQMGRCMYSGERIDLVDLERLYDIDHIYPQSKVVDDSITANKVLVKRTLNAKKGDRYPIPYECVSDKAKLLWRTLRDKKLISVEKYERLNRKNSFTQDELAGFISRQIVETRQSTKAVAGILDKLYTNSKVVYVKAGNVSKFRHDNDIAKSRIVNDFHHAKDAYLNIVVGNVYNEKFTSNPVNFIKKSEIYSMNKVFDYEVKKHGNMVWDVKENKSLNDVLSQVDKNNILFTRYATDGKAGFFDQMPMKKGKGQYPLKSEDARLANIEQYGGYNKVAGAYFFLVEHTDKKKRVKTMEYVTVIEAKNINKEVDLVEYAERVLGLVEPRILIKKIKINSLFKINGMKLHVSGRNGTQIIAKNAIQLLMSNEDYKYIAKVEKYINKNKEKKTIYPITEKQVINSETNVKIYDLLTDKLRNSIYGNMPALQLVTLENGREKFVEMDIYKQTEQLYILFSLFDSTPATTDLCLVGGSKNAGKLAISKNLDNAKTFSIINQSVTGLFEQEIDLKKL